MAIAAPFLSLFDIGASAEGSIDPLSLAQTYDHLADRLLPHITVRMQRPRYLTSIAVGAVVCEDLLDDLAADQRTPSWLVFEWHVVEAFVRSLNALDGREIWGIPGSQKVGRVLRFGRRVAADSYLKTPKVFGFTGVYLRLARSLQIVDDEMRLDEGGYELLRVWEEEQELSGFQSANSGDGAEFRNSLRDAVTAAMKKGYVVEGPSWRRWSMLFTHLRPDSPGTKECELIAGRLLRPQTDAETAEVSEELLRALQRRGRGLTREEEPAVLRKLMGKASTELRGRLALVDAYEGLARSLTDGFTLIRYLSTEKGGASITADDFARTGLAKRIVKQLPAALNKVEELFAADAEGPAVLNIVARYRDVVTPNRLFDELVHHHEDAQAAKPPNGKRPWLERINGVAVRPQYVVHVEPENEDEYVHEYRTPSASQFLKDLGKLPR